MFQNFMRFSTIRFHAITVGVPIQILGVSSNPRGASATSFGRCSGRRTSRDRSRRLLRTGTCPLDMSSSWSGTCFSMIFQVRGTHWRVSSLAQTVVGFCKDLLQCVTCLCERDHIWGIFQPITQYPVLYCTCHICV